MSEKKESLTPAQKRLQTIQQRQEETAKQVMEQNQGEPTEAQAKADQDAQKAQEQLGQARDELLEAQEAAVQAQMPQEQKQVSEAALKVSEASLELQDAQVSQRLAGVEVGMGEPSAMTTLQMGTAATLAGVTTGRTIQAPAAPQTPTSADAVVASAAEQDLSGGVYGNRGLNAGNGSFEQTTFEILGKKVDPDGNEVK